MSRVHRGLLILTLVLVAGITASAGQTILTAFVPAQSDGSEIILKIDWAQVKAAAPEVAQVMLRRRLAQLPAPMDTIGFIPVDSSRVIDSGLEPGQAYRYYAYFKDAEGETLRFGSIPAVVYLGPLRPQPAP